MTSLTARGGSCLGCGAPSSRLHRHAFYPTLVTVQLFWLLGYFPMVLLLTWAVALYLTFVETRQRRMDWRHTLCWIQLTFLFHFAGYLALRGWVFYRRRRVTV